MSAPDYMSRAEEVAKQPDALATVQQIAAAAAPGQQVEAFNAMWSFWNLAHVWDDLIDNSGWASDKKELAYKALQEFASDLLLNPLYRNHAQEFRGLFTMAIARQMDGDALAWSEDPKQAALAPAVRCADVDILVHFAYLIGGWKLMRDVGKRREYDVEKDAEKLKS